MSQSLYYSVTVKPTIIASDQHAEAYAADDVLFDWTAFDVPKGASKLIGVTAEIRPKGDAGSTVNTFAFELLFAKTKIIFLLDQEILRLILKYLKNLQLLKKKQ